MWLSKLMFQAICATQTARHVLILILQVVNIPLATSKNLSLKVDAGPLLKWQKIVFSPRQPVFNKLARYLLL
jgi:hypothetical protein